MNIQKITRLLFWLAFISYMSISIPKIAWTFHSYEESKAIYTWLVPYAVAISIDVTVCWLSYVQSNKKGFTSWLTWIFIIVITLFSIYCNYLYSMKFSPSFIGDVWTIPLFFGLTNTGELTPKLVACVPLLTLSYAFMLSKVGNNAMSYDEYKIALTEKNKLKSLKRVNRIMSVKNGVNSSFQIVNHMKDAIANKVDFTKLESDIDYSKIEGDTIVIEDNNEDTEDSTTPTTEDVKPTTEEVKPTTEEVKVSSNGHSSIEDILAQFR